MAFSEGRPPLFDKSPGDLADRVFSLFVVAREGKEVDILRSVFRSSSLSPE